jgi:polar amino acid transport system substrate-binding protein
VVDVPAQEKEPTFGCFAFAKGDDALRQSVDRALESYLGSAGHRAMMARHGFRPDQMDLVVNWRG